MVFRGNEHEASGQLLKGTVVLCLTSSLKLEDIHLKLIGTANYAYVTSLYERCDWREQEC